jgi:F420-dependent oxidoreductase-like protein
MRIGTGIGYASGMKEAAARVAELEAAGVDVVWVAEAYGVDGVSLMGYLAAITERVQIGSGILPIYSRTPTLLAMTAAGVDLLSGGRCILGLGASGPQVIEGFHGVPYDAPIGRTREIIEICRKVWRREVVEQDGKYYKLPLPPEQGTGLGKPLKMITHPVRDRIPIYVASLGPKNVEMTAEVADGWIPTLFWPERAADVWGESLAKGAANRAADLGPLETVAGGPVAIGEGLEHLRDRARPGIALYVGGMGARDRNFYNQLFRRYGFEKEADEIQELYLAGKKEEAAAAVPQEFLDATSLIGPAGFVKERIEAYKAAGVTILNASPMGGDTAKTLEQVKAWAS